MPKYPKGNFLGPTVLEGVTADMDCYKEEVFAPVLSCMQVCIQLPNHTPHTQTPVFFPQRC